MTTSDPPKAKPDRSQGSCDLDVPSVDAVIQGKIGQKLREHYHRVVSEPIPDRFLELLEQLKKKDPPPAEDGT